jgi:hypothetical protein
VKLVIAGGYLFLVLEAIDEIQLEIVANKLSALATASGRTIERKVALGQAMTVPKSPTAKMSEFPVSEEMGEISNSQNTFKLTLGEDMGHNITGYNIDIAHVDSGNGPGEGGRPVRVVVVIHKKYVFRLEMCPDHSIRNISKHNDSEDLKEIASTLSDPQSGQVGPDEMVIEAASGLGGFDSWYKSQLSTETETDTMSSTKLEGVDDGVIAFSEEGIKLESLMVLDLKRMICYRIARLGITSKEAVTMFKVPDMKMRSIHPYRVDMDIGLVILWGVHVTDRIGIVHGYFHVIWI